MGFTFRLEAVLKFRQRTVDRQSREVADAGRSVQAVAARLAEMEMQFQRELGDPAAGGSRIRVQDLMVKAAWLEYLRGRRRNLESELAVARGRLAAAQEKLKEAWRDLEVLQRLKRKQHAAWVKQIQKQENKDLDEIGQIRADRRRRSILARQSEQLS